MLFLSLMENNDDDKTNIIHANTSTHNYHAVDTSSRANVYTQIHRRRKREGGGGGGGQAP